MVRKTTFTGARDNLGALMDQVTDTREPVYIRRRGGGRRPHRGEGVELVDGDRVPPDLAEECREAEGAEASIAAGKGIVMTVEELREAFGLQEHD